MWLSGPHKVISEGMKLFNHVQHGDGPLSPNMCQSVRSISAGLISRSSHKLAANELEPTFPKSDCEVFFFEKSKTAQLRLSPKTV